MHLGVPYFGRKTTTSTAVIQFLVAERVAEELCEYIQAFAGALADPVAPTCTAAFVVPVLNEEHSSRLSLCTYSTIAEVSALRTAIQHIRVYQQPCSSSRSRSRSHATLRVLYTD